MSELNNIWNNGQGELSEEMLKKYIEGKLTPEQQYEVEQYLSEDSLEADAIEGLKSVDSNEARELTARINYKLQHELKTKKYRNNKLFADNKWTWMAVLLVLILVIIAYVVIKIA